MRVCTKCKEEKPETEFHYRNKKKGTLRYMCKACQKDYNKQHYLNNKDAYLNRAKERNKVLRGEKRDFVWEYLSKHPCVDCGETDPIVLEFDHRNRNQKRFSVSAHGMTTHSFADLQAEILKCDIRCSNCHRRRTALQLGWWKDKIRSVG